MQTFGRNTAGGNSQFERVINTRACNTKNAAPPCRRLRRYKAVEVQKELTPLPFGGALIFWDRDAVLLCSCGGVHSFCVCEYFFAVCCGGGGSLRCVFEHGG